MKKRLITIGIIIILLVLLIPIPTHLKDGGSIKYNALTYQITKVHSLKTIFEEETSGKKYNEGIIIKILGFEIFNNVK